MILPIWISIAVLAALGWLGTPLLRGAGFVRIAPEESGLVFTNTLPDAVAAANQIRLNGSGVALADVDGDGRCDVYLCHLDGRNALFRNLGNGLFTNLTAQAFPAPLRDFTDSTGAVFADVDGDGDPDLLVNGIGRGTRLFLNEGHGLFSEKADSGLANRGGTTSMALADIDGDGDLDLYVAHYRTTTLRTTGLELLNIQGRRRVKPEDQNLIELAPDGRVLEHGEPDVLYRNEGAGRFTAMSWTDGTFVDEDGKALAKPPFDWGLSVAFRDLDGDGAPDLYVCNDFHSPDRLWLNDGKGRFRAAPRGALRHTPTFSMSVDFADFDRDGREDFIVADMLSRDPGRRRMQLAGGDPYHAIPGATEDRPQFDRNALQWNRGDGTYADLAPYAGIEATDWTWSIAAIDVDLDGFEDLLCTTGHGFDTQDLDAEARIQQAGPWSKERVPQKLLMFPRMAQARQAWRNNGDRTFTGKGTAWGFAERGVAHGMAFADLDGDGDLDAVVNELNAPASVYRNQTEAGRLAVRLAGKGPNTRGIGARIRVTQPGLPLQSTEVTAGGRYLSGDEGLRVFAARGPMEVEVRWRNGTVTRKSGVQPGRLTLHESEAVLSPPIATVPVAPLFREAPLPGNAPDTARAFDDFAREPLLPHKLSTDWPAVAWSDLDGKGRPDLLVGAGTGGQWKLWRNSATGLVAGNLPGAALPVPRSFSGMLGLTRSPGQRAIVAGNPSLEDGSVTWPQGLLFDPATGMPLPDSLPGFETSVGPLCAADVDGDGDLDLFLGARVRPGQWPLSGPSHWYRNDGGHWSVSAEWSAAFEHAGMVTAAVSTDLDGDGRPDLALATELGPVRVWRNDGGHRFVEFTREAGLGGHLGRWHGIAAGDFDGDGRLDLVVANDGLNTGLLSAREQGSAPTPEGPVVWFGDIDGDGRGDILEGRWDPEGRRTVPERDLESLMKGLPLLPERFPSFELFNRASLAEVAGTARTHLQVFLTTWLPSTVFLNRGDHFQPLVLPPEAQFSPAFGVVPADFDGDGRLDLFLGQNFHAAHSKMPRMDAGLGLVLLGDGTGRFRSLSPAESGVRIPGEQRGAAWADFDGDGRGDLAVGVNHGRTVLLHNTGARPALRLRLDAGPGNPTGIGATVRRLGNPAGPRHEIHAGSGFLSQDEALVLLPRAGQDAVLEVTWPDGKSERHRKAEPEAGTDWIIRKGNVP
jgi:hypothetical protein